MAASGGAMPEARAQQIQGYGHRHWDAEEGSPSDIRAIAQTRDGFLWLGTSNGLYRFDGIGFEKIESSTYNRWRSNQITALAAAPDGALWVGYDFGGVGIYRDGQLRDANSEKRPPGSVWNIAVGSDGDVWVTINGSAGARLNRLHKGKWYSYSEKNWLAAEPIQSVFVAKDGGVWISQFPSVLRLAPGASRPERVRGKTGLASFFAEDEKHQIWMASSLGLQRLTGEPLDLRINSRGPSSGAYGLRSLLIDEGVAWIAGNEEGLIRLPISDRTAGPQETTPIRSVYLFRDREGTIWGGGADGLVRYVRSPILAENVAGTAITGLAAGAAPGSPLYMATDAGVYRLADGPPRMILPMKNVDGVCAGPQDLLWVMAGPTSHLYRNGRWTRHDQPTSQYSAAGCAIGPNGEIWVASRDAIFRVDETGWRKVPEWPSVQFIVSDGGSGLYANLPLKSVFLFKPGMTKVLWSGDDIAVGFVKLIKKVGPFVYVGGEKGLARFDGKRFVTLESRFHPWLNGVTGFALGESNAWVISNEGIARIAAPDFQRAFDSPQRAIPHTLLGTDLGFVGRKFAYMADDAALDAQGRPWFVTSRGVIRIEPTRIRRNQVAPPVTIRALTANEKSYSHADVELPAGTSRVQFDYVALSLTDPTRNRYRYQLDGVDDNWVEAGGRRQGTYTGLGPGTYKFKVVAANPDGVWNLTGAQMTITIVPYFWQTWWFKTALVLIFAILLWAFVQWRMRAAAEAARQRIEDRIAVREHIAQDLHDTLLQGFQGLVLRFQSTVERLPSGDPARAELESTLDRADDVLQEGRDRVRFLREETEPVDLGIALTAIAEDVLQKQVKWSVKEAGVIKPVCAPVADDIARIANEAIFNALRHAQASMISIRILHQPDHLSVCVADNGVGLDSTIKDAGAKAGHYGLVGMRERAQRLGGIIKISDVEPSGTEIRLTLPARIPYR